ncbi:hypothetical protein C8J57DRAFT_1623680 [Mycena rebaudengoi]|nr:hypothetical protein C8J57DRAFT_1623680 [Mycena rebaudengoi]
MYHLIWVENLAKKKKLKFQTFRYIASCKVNAVDMFSAQDTSNQTSKGSITANLVVVDSPSSFAPPLSLVRIHSSRTETLQFARLSSGRSSTSGADLRVDELGTGRDIVHAAQSTRRGAFGGASSHVLASYVAPQLRRRNEARAPGPGRGVLVANVEGGYHKRANQLPSGRVRRAILAGARRLLSDGVERGSLARIRGAVRVPGGYRSCLGPARRLTAAGAGAARAGREFDGAMRFKRRLAQARRLTAAGADAARFGGGSCAGDVEGDQDACTDYSRAGRAQGRDFGWWHWFSGVSVPLNVGGCPHFLWSIFSPQFPFFERQDLTAYTAQKTGARRNVGDLSEYFSPSLALCI